MRLVIVQFCSVKLNIMKTVDSLYLIHDLEKRIEVSINLAVTTFQNLDAPTLLKPSASGGWSIAQCLEHLNSYGDYYLPHIQTRLSNNLHAAPNPYFKSSWLGNYFIKMMLPGSGKKYPAMKKHMPKKDLDPYKVVATFIHQQELLLSYLEMAKTKDLNAIKIPISIFPFIKLKSGDVFQFIIAHNQRHLEQAKRNLS